MPVVAIVGGTQSIGRAVLEGIQERGTDTAIVLSRKYNKEIEQELGARLIAADYDDVTSLVKLLEENNVETVISGTNNFTGGGAEINLIRASELSSTTKRFIPSVWGCRYGPDKSDFPAAMPKIASEKELEKTSLQWTAVCIGFFLDYFGMPKVKSHLRPTTMVLDIVAAKAAIPGSGDVPGVFTYSQDVGKFVAALLTLPEWEKESYIIGEKLTWSECLRLAEDVRGTKFDVTYDSVELLKSGRVTELPGHVPDYEYYPKEQVQAIIAGFQLLFEEGYMDFKPKQTLNNLFPDIRAVSAKEMLEMGWKL
ncbi:NAD(P)-binding protein [Hypoxylon crocopeplum]|nr:NAD(P)-binding protein [Hypoxylon crocopeplum]